MRTSQIEEWLSESEYFDENLIKENSCPECSTLITGYMAAKGMARAELIRKLNIDRNYGYQLLNGTRNPTRNHIIQIGLILELNMEQFQRLLKTAKKKPLYVRDMFDAKVFYAVKHKINFSKATEFIWGNEEIKQV